jgi:Fe2+ transport system protein FeoA
VTLDELEIGKAAVVTGIDGDGPLIQRLMALGLLEGEKVVILRRALGGDPLEIETMGYSLSLRRTEAAQVNVSAQDG